MFESVPRTLNWLYFLFLQMKRCAAPNTKNISQWSRRCIHQKSPLGNLPSAGRFRGPFSMPSHYYPIYAQTTVCVISCAGVHWTKIRFFKPGINLTLHSSRKSPMGDLGGRSLISAVTNRIVHLREKRINKVLFPVIRIATKIAPSNSPPALRDKLRWDFWGVHHISTERFIRRLIIWLKPKTFHFTLPAAKAADNWWIKKQPARLLAHVKRIHQWKLKANCVKLY